MEPLANPLWGLNMITHLSCTPFPTIPENYSPDNAFLRTSSVTTSSRKSSLMELMTKLAWILHPSLYSHPLQGGLIAPPVKRYNLLPHILILTMTMWLALADGNWILTVVPQRETYKSTCTFSSLPSPWVPTQTSLLEDELCGKEQS